MTGLWIAYGVVLSIWLLRLVIVCRIRRQLIFLGSDSPRLEGADHLPHVSILVPARDEAETIAACVQSLLAQDYPNLEIIVIDDRSTDQTVERVQAFVARDPRVRLERVGDLPAGWTGKTHALHRGVARATGDWLLFVDADTRHHPFNLRVLLHFALKEQAELVSLLPSLRARSFWETVVQPLAGVVLMIFFRLPRVNSDQDSAVAFANGQYILIRRSAYDAVGGHASVRTHFVEDIQLARRIKRAGRRLRVVLAPELSETRMYRSLAEIHRGWSRILYGAVDHRPGRLLMVMALMITLSLSAYVTLGLALMLLLLGYQTPPVWTLFGLSLLHHALLAAVMSRLYGFSRSSRWAVLFYLPASLVVLSILARAVRLCCTHEVSWRGTHYGPELRQG